MIIYIDAKENPNKFNMDQLFITGIDIDIGNILTYGIGLISHKNKYQINWILTKFCSEIETLNKGTCIKTIVCDLDKLIIKVVEQTFPES
jgi:hypothetical protein